jgi:hypothetical protein
LTPRPGNSGAFSPWDWNCDNRVEASIMFCPEECEEDGAGGCRLMTDHFEVAPDRCGRLQSQCANACRRDPPTDPTRIGSCNVAGLAPARDFPCR